MTIRKFYYLKKAFDNVRNSRNQVERFQNRRLKEIIELCSDLDFYREKTSSGRSSDFPLNDFKPLNSEDLNKNEINPRSTKSNTFKTSGISHSRKTIKHDKESISWTSALYTRNILLNNYKIRQKILQYGDPQKEKSWIGKKLIPVNYLSPENSLKHQLDAIESHNPDIIDYFPQVLLGLVKYAKKSNRLEDIQVDKIFTRGELLTPATKDYIENNLNAEIFDNYASSEFGPIAWSCKEEGYHIAEDLVYPEIFGEDKTERSRVGELGLTTLVNTATPLVRYRTGDLVKQSVKSCSCNTSFKRIKKIIGRKENIFLNSEGDPIFPNEIVNLVAPIEEIIYFQIVARDDMYILKHKTSRDSKESDINKVVRRLKNNLSLEPIKVKELDQVPKSPGGKIKIIENRQNYQYKL